MQFAKCRFRGYITEEGMPENPFADKAYDTAFKEYQSRNSERVERQKARELKKEGKAKLEKRKKL